MQLHKKIFIIFGLSVQLLLLLPQVCVVVYFYFFSFRNTFFSTLNDRWHSTAAFKNNRDLRQQVYDFSFEFHQHVPELNVILFNAHSSTFSVIGAAFVFSLSVFILQLILTPSSAPLQYTNTYRILNTMSLYSAVQPGAGHFWAAGR